MAAGMRLEHLRKDFVERFELHVDGARALRAGLAFALPLTVAHALGRPVEAIFISLAAQNLANPDIRGSYHVRVAILFALTLIASAGAWLGVACAGSLPLAVGAMGLLALLGGVWRHLSADYGPAASVGSSLLFLIGLSQGGSADPWRYAAMVVAGGGVATLAHAAYWLFRPQHALRNAVAEPWVAISDMVASMRRDLGGAPGVQSASARAEGEVRAALDSAYHVLGDARSERRRDLLDHLERLRHEAVQFSAHAVALRVSLEPIAGKPSFGGILPPVDSVLKALGDAARSVALTLIMHRDADFAASSLRLRRCQHLIDAAVRQIAALAGEDADGAAIRSALQQLSEQLARTQASVAETTGHATRGLGMIAGLADMGALPLRSLAAWIRPASRIDPLLVRHSVRMAVLTMVAVGLYVHFDLPRGYWIALTILVVLQPDFGSTRKRAWARIVGTVGGMLVASGLLWVRLPLAALDLLASAMAFFFSYHLRRTYRLAVFFVTIDLVLITETHAAVSWDFVIDRVLATLAGGTLALLAAMFFWPVWERESFASLLVAAVRSNRAFLRALAGLAGPGGAPPGPLLAKRNAENANRTLAASVERMLGEPASQRELPERSATLALYNQRMTRALTALSLQPEALSTHADSLVRGVANRLEGLMEELAAACRADAPADSVARLEAGLDLAEAALTGALDAQREGGATSAGSSVLLAQLSKALGELRAMALALRMAS